MTNEELSLELYNVLPEWQKELVMTYKNKCDLVPDFMGFVDVYYHLSQIIPKHWNVIDIGCSYNAQCYYFREHNRFLAVEPDNDVEHLFYMDNTSIYRCTGQHFIEGWLPMLNLNLKETFAICNAVPNNKVMELVRQTFPKCYVSYPAPKIL